MDTFLMNDFNVIIGEIDFELVNLYFLKKKTIKQVRD